MDGHYSVIMQSDNFRFLLVFLRFPVVKSCL